MLDHIFLTVSDIDRSIAFYERVLPLLGITARLDYDGKDGPTGHPALVILRRTKQLAPYQLRSAPR